MALTKITRGVIKANENYDTHNINSTGIVTAVSANFTGDVSIGGTLTYQDVTNIDSVGVITARAGVHVTSGNVAVGHNSPSVNLHVKGSASNGQIYLGGTGAHSQIYADNDGVLILNADQGNSAANSYLGFNVDNSEKLRITSSGNLGVGNVDPTQARLVAQTASGMSIAAVKDNTGASISLGGVTQPRVLLEAGASASELKLYTAGGSSYGSASWAERLRITSSGNLQLYSGGNLQMASNGRIFVGNGGNATDPMFANVSDTNTGIAFPAADTMMFTTGGTERLRISSDGALFVGEYSGSGRFVLHNADQSGGADTTYSKDKGFYVRNDCGPTHVDLTGVDNFTAKIHNGAYAGSGVSNPQGTITKILLHGVTYNGYNAYGSICLDVQNANSGRGDLVFLNGGNNTSTSERLRITSGGTVKVNTAELQTTAGDKFAQIRGGGVINTKRLATGNFANTSTYRPQQYGYIGDYMHYGCNAVYFLAETSTGNSGYSSHMFSWYDSGHWGHYGKFVLMCQESGYIGGMAHRYLSGTTVTDIFGFGNNGGVSTTSTQTGSGTHSGQSVTRYDCTVSHTSTYRTMRWYLGVMHGCLSGVTGNGKTQSEVNTYANSNGSHLHLFGVSDSNLTMAPNYRTW